MVRLLSLLIFLVFFKILSNLVQYLRKKSSKIIIIRLANFNWIFPQIKSFMPLKNNFSLGSRVESLKNFLLLKWPQKYFYQRFEVFFLQMLKRLAATFRRLSFYAKISVVELLLLKILRTFLEIRL